MSALSIQPTYPIFTDIDGQPLEDGYIWIGTANLDPQVNPITIYWDAALTLPAAQPIRTLAGYPSNSGTPARIYVNSNYSIRVMNKNGSAVYSAPSATERYSGAVVTGLDASSIDFLQAGTGAVVQTVQTKLRRTVDVKDFGATGDGVTNDTVAVQNAIDSLAATGGVVHFPPGEYRIARNIGVNDRWGIKVTNSNITLKGDQAFLRRFDTNIVSNANVYPILFVGVPDSNVAPLTTNIIIDSLNFIGENTQHNVVGSSLTDFRNAIEFKNTSDTWVKDCQFTAIDSQAIQYQYPASYDYANGQYYNTTKNYKSKISGCSFIATPHSVPGRALIHCIVVGGIDFCNIVDNYFEWCDDCVSGETQYNRYTDTEDDTFTRSGGAAALGPLRRCGRNIVISSNTVYNSSEHCFYTATMDTTIIGNNIRTDDPAVCTGDMIKIRGRGVTVSGNLISNYAQCISVNDPSMDVTVTGNVCQSSGNSSGGVIDINSDGLVSYITNRPFFYIGGSPDFQPMRNISITGNTIILPNDTTAPVAGREVEHIAFRIYTDAYTASFPEGQIQGIAVVGNIIKNYNVGFYFINDQYRDMVINSNSLYAKDFTTSGFNAGTSLRTYSVMQSYQSGAGSTLLGMYYTTFSNNNVFGATNLFTTDTGLGSAGTYYLPVGITGNRLSYIKALTTADVRGFSAAERFRDNSGTYVLDRTWGGTAMENSLGNGTTSASQSRFCTEWTGSQYRFYTDDAGTFITLN